MKVTGQVFKVYDKTFNGRTLFSVKLENDPLYYRMGVNRGAGLVEPGNWITFEAKPNADGKSAEIQDKPELVTPPAAAPQAVAAAGPVSSGGGRETSIHYQSARKDALQFVALAAEAGAVTLPAKAAAKLAALEALLDHYTTMFFEDIGSGGAIMRNSERAEEVPAKKNTKAAGDEGDDGAGDDD